MSSSLKSLLILSALLTLTACDSPPNENAQSTQKQTSDSGFSSLSVSDAPKAQTAQIDFTSGHWQYIQIDDQKQMWGDWNEPEWLRYFGLAFGDINGDTLTDIVSGRYVYLQHEDTRQPTASKWERIDLGANVDAILVLDIDGDSKLDIIAQALPSLYWFELEDEQAGTFKQVEIGQVPATSHVNSQGFTAADIAGDKAQEFIVAGNGNLYVFSHQVQSDGSVAWTEQLIAQDTSDEGIGVGDIDGDGDIDIAAGRRPGDEPEPKQVIWFENPGHINAPWQDHFVGEGSHPIDRVEIADLNEDGKGDIVFTEERYPGLEPDAQMVMFLQQDEQQWDRQVLVTQFSMNNLDIADVDQDGDLDIITAEHKGEALETQLWINDGEAEFSAMTIDTGKESHLGTQFVDIDADGDLDVISAGWDQHQYVHLWLNPLISQVSFSEVIHLEREHINIKTSMANYLFDTKGGGFSSIFDVQGNDWLSFKLSPWGDYPAAAAGGFRGMPNAVHGDSKDSGAGHPGFDKMRSEIIDNTIVSTSNSGDWQWQYRFYPHGVKMEVLAMPDNARYWFLYEGTPGGKYDIAQTFYGTDSTSWHSDAPDFYQGSIKEGQFNWAYFSHLQSEQSLYLVQLTPDTEADIMSYLGNSEQGANSEDGMVVFGFGRDAQGNAKLNKQHSFFIGLAPHVAKKNQDHAVMANYISTIAQQHQKESTYAR